ncbi:endonuclease/exonuclease/phosphatase family protein [Sulfurimonas sp.]|jgi:predicted extracellular nuclease|uniref:endonuclease/exonuclease/phosphatase family protein n=1 Tax=Sulfurimonas sp. TaxID=2022749 RepID=UPI0025EE6B48|nr:endonuclease/exonuclease/phosphatase family protein [Sulfurimonas sp.]
MKIATYNVENLFDLQKSGHEYMEYIPYTPSMWNKVNYHKKLKNIAQVIQGMNADVIVLQEIESLQSLKDLRYTLKQIGLYYQYYKIADKKNTTIKVALLSKIPFIYSKELQVTSSYKYRNILEVKLKLPDNELYLFVNHWKSKAGPESMRIVSAKKLLERTQQLGKDKNIILLGDFNSHYQENKIFIRKRRHNDTNGVTGINNILKTNDYKYSASLTNVKEGDFYNLWYDTKDINRYSYIFRGKKEALDNILISSSLLNDKNISYKKGSITSYKPEYLFKRKNIYRWQVRGKKPRVHKGKGFSDHLGVTAEFVLH